MNPWIGGWTLGETVRTVELPALGEVKEGELGSLVVGDWLMLISPVMKGLTVSSGAWWDQVLAVAAEAYARRILCSGFTSGRGVEDDGGRWSRVAQRAQAMLVAALPGLQRAGRFCSGFTRYQPGGLAERSQLLRGLVEPRVPTTLSEVVDGVRTWKRWLARTRELRVAIPDATGWRPGSVRRDGHEAFWPGDVQIECGTSWTAGGRGSQFGGGGAAGGRRPGGRRSSTTRSFNLIYYNRKGQGAGDQGWRRLGKG